VQYAGEGTIKMLPVRMTLEMHFYCTRRILLHSNPPVKRIFRNFVTAQAFQTDLASW